MAEIILHHYDTSPFSEKVRVMLGVKGLSWRSVIQPVIMPKPELVPLTGGYRRIPVLQIGADVYCDTQVILAELEARQARFGAALAIAGLGTFEWDIPTGTVRLDDRSREIFGFRPHQGGCIREIFERRGLFSHVV